MKCVRVELKQAEKIRVRLLKLGVFDKDHKIVRDNKYVYFPVIKPVEGFDIMDKKLEKRDSKLTLEGVLKNKMNKKEFGLLKRAYDVVGGIAILEINRELLDKRKVIAEALLKVNRNIKTVVKKSGGHEGNHRIQKYEFLVGKKSFETLCKENGIILKLDIRKVYFSPRLSHERLRVAKLVKEGEDVLIMFSGISPYDITIAKHSKANEIYGIEINKDAYKYAKENLKLNTVNKVKLFCGDVKKVLPKLGKKFDRVIMPLPKTAGLFLGVALKALKKNGIIHFYCFSEEENAEDIIKVLKGKAKVKILDVVKCGQSKPKVFRYCIDFKVF